VHGPHFRTDADIALGAVAEAQFAIVHEFLDEVGRVVSATGGDVGDAFCAQDVARV
jgi:hypothetical protein